ncbi:MAG: hypothetical protein ABUL58_01820 [Steroidobacter sp.]
MLKKLIGTLFLTSQGTAASTVESLNAPHKIKVEGFEVVEKASHMLQWLGKGDNFREYIVNDIEKELYAQDRGSQLMSVLCKSEPNYETKAIKNSVDSSKVVVTQFSVTFPLIVKIRASDGQEWSLDVQYNYTATNLNNPGQKQLALNFTIIGQEK